MTSQACHLGNPMHGAIDLVTFGRGRSHQWLRPLTSTRLRRGVHLQVIYTPLRTPHKRRQPLRGGGAANLSEEEAEPWLRSSRGDAKGLFLVESGM